MKTRKVLLSFLLVFVVFSHFDATFFPIHSETTWFRVGQTLFPGGLGQAITTNGQGFYILRQFIRNTRIDFQQLTLSDGLVTQTANLRSPPHDIENGAAMVSDLHGNLFVLFGGGYPERRKLFGRYAGGQWTDLQETPVDQGAGDAITFVIFQEQRYVYAIVGAASSQRAGAVTAFLRYSLTGKRWKQLTGPPWACSDDGSSLAWDGDDFVYALQGADCNDEPTTTFARYYLALDLWEKLEEVPEPVKNGGSLVWNGNEFLYATSGTDTQRQGTGFYRYNLQSQTWDTSLPPLNCSVGDYNGNRLAIVDDRIFYWQGTPPTWADSADCNGRGVYLFAWR